MTTEVQPRFGYAIDTAGTDYWSRGHIMGALDAIDAQAARYGAGTLTSRPTASVANDGMFWWTGSRLSYCDGQHIDTSGTLTPRWVDLTESDYVSVRDYGAEPLENPSYVPRAPVGGPPPNYDPYLYWRGFDCAAKFTQAANDAIRTGKILFIPPGVYPLFKEVVMSGDTAPVPSGSPSSGRPAAPAAGPHPRRHLRVLGSWPDTILWCFGDVVGTNALGAPLTYTGLNATSKVINVTDSYGTLVGAHVEGLRFVGGAWDESGTTSVLECVGFETNAQITVRSIIVEKTMKVHGSAVDLSAGISITQQQPHSVENVTIIGPPVAYSARPANLNPAAGNVAGVQASLPFVRLRNIHVENYQAGLYIVNGNGADTILVEGLSCRGSQITDIYQVGVVGVGVAGNLFARGVSSIDSARLWLGGTANAQISGVFRATSTGNPSESSAAAADFIRIISGGIVRLDNLYVTSAGGTVRTIGADSSLTSIDVTLSNTNVAATLAQIIRPIAGTNTRLTAWNHQAIDPSTGVMTARETRIPNTTPIAVTTTAPPASITDASTLPEVAKAVGQILKTLGMTS